MNADPDRPSIWAEGILSGAAEEDFPTLALADHACDEMGKVLQLIEPSAEPGESEQLQALQTLGIVAARSLRASMALIRFGYASEASVFHRRLAEAQQRVLRVLDPVNGKQRAQEWLKGRDRNARQVSGLEDHTWDAISHNAHADHRAVTSHYVEGRGIIRAFIPIRDVQVENGHIVMNAIIVHDIAVLIAHACGFTIDGADEFGATMWETITTYIPGGPAADAR